MTPARRVDVVIPAHDPGPWLRVALDSVLAQSFESWAAVVVDDGSSEDLAWVGTLDPRITLIRQANLGASAARNRGIAAGTGELVAFLDADDAWKADKLAIQVDALERAPDVGLCSTAFEIVDAAGVRVSAGYDGRAASYQDLLRGNGICTSTTIVPRRVLDDVGLFDPSLRVSQDWDLWLRIARHFELIRLDPVLAEYRIHAGSISSSYRTLLSEGERILGAHASLVRAAADPGDHDALRHGRGRLRQLAGIQAFDQARAAGRSNPGQAARHLGAAIRLAPGYSLRSLLRKALPGLRRPGAA